jgi:hypothetical protein
MFVMICTRPDIAQVVGAVSRYMANPGIEHWNTIKRILRYIKGTLDVVLCYEGSELLLEVMLIHILLVTLRKENPLQAMCS